MKLLLDMSVLAHLSWHKMSSLNYDGMGDEELESFSELEEFSKNMSSLVFSLVTRFQPEEVIFAMDGANYWRKAVYTEYYTRYCQFFKEKITLASVSEIRNGKRVEVAPSEMIYYMVYDNKYFSIKHYPELGKYKQIKLLKKEIDALNIKLETPNSGVEVLDVVPEGVLELMPSYKGNRKDSAWNYETSRKQFKELVNSISFQLSKTFKAKYLKVDSAEADDVAYVYDKLNSSSDCIFVTTDTDWHQLLRKGLFLKFFNPAKFEFVNKTSEQAAGDLAIKIMSGDASDNIPGLNIKGKNGLIGKATAEKLLIEKGVKGIYGYLSENVLEDGLKRNYALIYLPNCPKKIQKSIEEEISKKPVWEGALPLTKYGLTEQLIAELSLEAEQLRKVDIVNGFYN